MDTERTSTRTTREREHPYRHIPTMLLDKKQKDHIIRRVQATEWREGHRERGGMQGNEISAIDQRRGPTIRFPAYKKDKHKRG